MTMTREEKLYSMTGNTLIGVAEKLGLTVNKNILKQGKSKLIAKILEVEKQVEAPKEQKAIDPKEIKTQEDFLNAVSGVLDGKKLQKAQNKPVKAPEEAKAEENTKKIVKEPKKPNLKLSELTYKGETKSIKEWAAQINMPWATLYDRVNRNGWPIDLAIEIPLGQRRPKNKEA